MNEYPGIEPFYGLGQLSPEQLKELYHEKKQSISIRQISEAISGWKAYTSDNPTDIEKWIVSSKDELPYLKQALQYHLSHFPSVKTGLNEVEYLAPSFIRDKTCLFTELF